MKTKPTNNTGTLRRVLLTLGVGLLTGLPAFATATWTGANGDLWSDSANWSGGTPWADPEGVVINNGGTPAIQTDLKNPVRAITSGPVTISGASTLTLYSGLTVGGNVIIGAGDSNNSVNFSGSTYIDGSTVYRVTGSLIAEDIIVGQGAGSTNNSLPLASSGGAGPNSLTANNIYVGTAGATGNYLSITSTSAIVNVGTVWLAQDNGIMFLGSQSFEGMQAFFKDRNIDLFGGTTLVNGLDVSDCAALFTRTEMYEGLITAFIYTPSSSVPEPATYAALAGLALLAFAVMRKRNK
ncbi:PEP-CTERM sorting domain-containing protein [Opitutaceae bacterium TAV4]|nr:PEP-CTERM sorting domain-containing protein [Opitutaceae bacterium TAV4]RRK01936.1 PEP-CTERM sorting domain-containing protein [Opitutaceae bacterium TAV3]